MAHFEVRAWIAVSQEYLVKNLLMNLIQQVIPRVENSTKTNVEKMTDDQLLNEPRERLKPKRYLVVVNDIWETKAWDEIKNCFPSSNYIGSRVLITTRKKEVASYVRARCHEIVLLDKQQSWNLFCRKVFNDENGCPDELKDLGNNMVENCGGLPLAIAVLGGLVMRKEQTHHVWSKIDSRVKRQLTESEESSQCMDVLALSYNDLPYYLKCCFLYHGLVPEDTEILAEKLILLWMPQGFIQARGEEEMDDVAEDYIEELIQRRMIQVAKRKLNGRIYECRVHGLLRDLAQGKKSGFLDNVKNASTMPRFTRRLGISSSDHEHSSSSGYQRISQSTRPRDSLR